MAYRVDITARAERDLEQIYLTIRAESSRHASMWFNGLARCILSLDALPFRGVSIPEGGTLRHLLYGRKQHRYRIIYAVDEARRVVTIVHIRHGARDAFQEDDTGDE